MRVFFAVLALAVGGFFGYRHLAEQRAETALKESLCAEEMNEEMLAALPATVEGYSNRSVAQSAILGLAMANRMRESSLRPHVPALSRMAEKGDVLEQIHRIAAIPWY